MHGTTFVTIGGVTLSLYAVALSVVSVVLGSYLFFQDSQDQRAMGIAIILGNLVMAYGINCSITGGCPIYAAFMFALYMINTLLMFESAKNI